MATGTTTSCFMYYRVLFKQIPKLVAKTLQGNVNVSWLTAVMIYSMKQGT